MYKIVITTDGGDDYQTLGEAKLYKDGEEIFSFKTLELPWKENQRRISCIPYGNYKAIKHTSPKFGECLWIKDVEGRSEILMHKGNYKKDTLGCILCGEDFVDIDGDGHKDVTNSKKTMSKILSLIDSDSVMLTKELEDEFPEIDFDDWVSNLEKIDVQCSIEDPENCDSCGS